MKKFFAVVMSVCMVFAMSATAFAATLPASGNVTVYKDGSTSNLSMANAAFTTYTTTNTDGSVVVTMPLKKIERMGLYGYVTGDTTATINNTSIGVSVDYDESVTGGYYEDNQARLILTIPEEVLENETSPVKVDIHFDILLSSSTHWIESNITPNADLYLN